MKKSFTGQQNPALAFISQDTVKPNTEQEPNTEQGLNAKLDAHIKTTDAPRGFKVNPTFVETKSRRVQLLVQPSLYDAIKEKAKGEGQSVNEWIHSALEAASREG